VMHQGNLVAQAALPDLRAGHIARATVTTDQPQDAAKVLGELGATDIVVATDGVTAAMGAVPPEKTVAALVYAGVPVKGFAQSADLEDLFVSLTGEGFDVSG